MGTSLIPERLLRWSLRQNSVPLPALHLSDGSAGRSSPGSLLLYCLRLLVMRMLLLLLLRSRSAYWGGDFGHAPGAGADCLGDFFVGRRERTVHLQPRRRRYTNHTRGERKQSGRQSQQGLGTRGNM